MHMRHSSLWLLAAAVLSACGPAGTLGGKVNVEGGSATAVAVFIFGPTNGATVTKDDGSFSFTGLADGAYAVRATVRGAEVEELTVPASVAQGKGADVMLTFKLATSKLTGKVSFTDGSPALDLTVNAFGPQSAGARTAADGSYTLDNLKSGAYTVSVEAPNTKEGRVAIGVNAAGPVTVPELKLTPVGTIGGTVNYMAMPAVGATVTIPGTSFSARTDAMGKFSFTGVPAGMQTFLAQTGTAPFIRSATSTQPVARGANADFMIDLMDVAPPTGTVSGVVTFRGARTPRDITVTAVGSGVMGNPATNGQYSLNLPVGFWDIVASAPSHPPLTLGRVEVLSGRTVSLPGQELSWYRPVWTSQVPLSFIAAGGQQPGATHPWTFVALFEAGQQRLALFNGQTFEYRLVAVGNTSFQRLSATPKFAGWSVNNTAFVYDIMTGAISTFTAQNNITALDFSTDETVLFIARSGPSLTRITLASPGSPLVIPSSGNATGVFQQTPDRWFVQEGSDIRLVNPTQNITQVFSSVGAFGGAFRATPATFAYTNCTPNCQLRVLGPTATTAVQDNAVAAVVPGSLTLFANTQLQSRADHPCFSSPSTMAAFCVRASDGTHTALAGIPNLFKLNEMGDRVVWTFPQGLSTAVREELFPPSISTVNTASTSNGWSVGWMSPTRAFAYETTGMTRSLHLIKAGVDTVDNDVGTQGISETPPLLVVPQNSTSRWRAVLGDGPMRQIDVATMIGPLGSAARPLGTGMLTKYGAVSFDAAQMYVIDENLMMVKTVPGGIPSFGYRSGTAEYVNVTRPGSMQVGLYVFNNGAVLEAVDDVTPNATWGTIPLNGYFGLDAARLTLYAGVIGL